MKNIRFLVLIFSGIILVSCGETHFQIVSFDALTNFETTNDTLVLEMDLSGGPFQGITLPSQSGKHDAKNFAFRFEVENTSSWSSPVYYKIYYQNDSYKYSEVDHDAIILKNSYNRKAAENFYGSWISDSLRGFRQSKVIAGGSSLVITDSLFIAGNPLNDSLYYSYHPKNPNLTAEEIQAMVDVIKSNPDWYEAIATKAKEKNMPLERQVRDDAIWSIQNSTPAGNDNQRWQRNPRVGSYSFMLVVGDKESIKRLPESVQDISKIDRSEKVHMNPFYYFAQKIDPETSGIGVAKATQILKTYAIMRPDAGLFYDGSAFINSSQKSDIACNKGDDAFEYAHFSQFVNEEVLDSSLHNIDIKASVKGDKYSRKDFARNRDRVSRLRHSFVNKPETPCENAWYDPEENVLVVENPGNTSRPYKKENAGVEGRIGFAYGKFRARIKFPEMLSNDNVWNGITCAYWLKFQSLDAWNTRDVCEKEGYVIHGMVDGKYVNKRQDSYSEIDIEIIKTSRDWPRNSYRYKASPPPYDAALDNNVIVSCTNWDLACPDPKNFDVGARPFKHGDDTYTVHRWDKWYRALTLKTERPADKTVGSEFLYEIEWKPENITWRVGASAEEMDVVGYMDKTISKIPNNQMVPVMSQEFHYGHWWPMTPFLQGNIPYPAEPIRGYVYEVIVE